MLRSLLVSSQGSTRTLAILTANEQGAVVVLNLLLMADLANSFSAIWAPLADEGLPRGVCRDGEHWRIFNPPVDGMVDKSSKGDLLGSIVERPHEWFPQAVDGEAHDREAPQYLAPGNLHVKNIVLIDDEMTNFHCRSGSGHQVLRFCKVACYDDEYYDDFGLLMNMGGIVRETSKTTARCCALLNIHGSTGLHKIQSSTLSSPCPFKTSSNMCRTRKRNSLQA